MRKKMNNYQNVLFASQNRNERPSEQLSLFPALSAGLANYEHKKHSEGVRRGLARKKMAQMS